MKILIVEDETKTGDYLKQGSHGAGFESELICPIRGMGYVIDVEGAP